MKQTFPTKCLFYQNRKEGKESMLTAIWIIVSAIVIGGIVGAIVTLPINIAGLIAALPFIPALLGLQTIIQQIPDIIRAFFGG